MPEDLSHLTEAELLQRLKAERGALKELLSRTAQFWRDGFDKRLSCLSLDFEAFRRRFEGLLWDARKGLEPSVGFKNWALPIFGDLLNLINLEYLFAGEDLDALLQLMARKEEFWKRRAWRLLRIARDMDEEDALQELAVRFFAARDRYDPGKPFENWAATMLTNLCIDKGKRRASVRRDRPLGEWATQLPDRSASGRPDTIVSREEARKAMADCIGKLPDGQRAVALLDFAFPGISLDDIAGRLGITYGTAGSRRTHYRRSLKECLSNKGFGKEDYLGKEIDL